MRLSRRALGFAVVGGVTAYGTRAAAQANPQTTELPTLPLSIAVATIDGTPVVDDRWVADQVRETQRLFRPHGVTLAVARRRPLVEAMARLETAEDRDALAQHLEQRVINVFVVDTLRDVDDPRLLRMGVRWRKRSDLRKDYVIVAESAMATTLCHELGHYFGNPHSFVVNNVMSYRRDDPDKVAFDDQQGRRMRSIARSHLRSGKLVRIDDLHMHKP
jgi:hypothetical protein